MSSPVTSPTNLTQAITQMFNALVTAIATTVQAIANWITENADLIASLVMLGLIIAVVVRFGRRAFEAIRGLLPF